MISLMDLIWDTETEEDKHEDEYGVNATSINNSNQMEQYCQGSQCVFNVPCISGRW